MQNNRLFQSTFYLVERGMPDLPRFLLYSRSFEVDSEVYLSRISEDGAESRFHLAGREEGTGWVPIDLIVRRAIQSAQEHDEFLASLRSGRFDLPLTGPAGSRSGFSVTPRQEVIQFNAESAPYHRAGLRPESGIGAIARVESFWPEDNEGNIRLALDPFPGLDDLAQVSDDKGRNALEPIAAIEAEREFERRLGLLVQEMTRLTGLSFNGAYAERLCNIEVLDIPFRAHLVPAPVSVEVEREERGNLGPNAYGVRVRRGRELADQESWAHVVLRNGGDILVDRLVLLPKGQAESELICANEVISEYEVEVFGPQPNGGIIFAEGHPLVRTIVGTGMVQSGTKTYRDKLASKLEEQKSGVGERLAAATPFSPSTFSSEVHVDDPWIHAAQRLRRLLGVRAGRPKASRWFPRGLVEQGEVVEYLRELVDRPHNHEVLIADPFFGLTAFGLLIPRLRHSGLPLTVITSCLGWDPDEEEARGKKPQWEIESANQRKRLASWCERNSAFIEPNLTIVDIRSGGVQAFHDRYLACVDDEGEVSVYCISSSLNKLAGNYPCCITELEESAARQVYAYLRGLAAGWDIALPERGSGKKLDQTMVWAYGPSRTQQREAMLRRPRLPNEGPPQFEFWRPFLSWILDLKDCKDEELITSATKLGFVRCAEASPSEWARPESFIPLLDAAWNRLPRETSAQAELLGGLGEYLAYSHGGENVPIQVTEVLQREGKGLETVGVLNHLESCYAEIPPPGGRKGMAPTTEELSAAAYLDETTEPSFQLLMAAESYLEMHYEVRVFGLYGLRWAIRSMLVIHPAETLTWAEREGKRDTHTCAAILASIIETIVGSMNSSLAEYLLRCQRPFFRMMGVASLFWNGAQKEGLRSRMVQDSVIAQLEASGVSEGDILWTSALHVSHAQAAEFRTLDLSPEDPKRKDAERELVDLLEGLAEILVRAHPNKHQLDQLDQALRLSARDRFHVATTAQQLAGSLLEGPWIDLYRRCVNDVEQLVGRIPNDGFSFYAHSDFDKLDVGAQASARLDKGKIAKRLRNRLQGHLERLVLDASDPFASDSNYENWSQAVGRAAAGCLFAFLVCQHARCCGEEDHLSEAIETFTAITCQLYLGERTRWFDLGGLLDRLAQEAAWAVASLGNEEAEEIADRAIDDERLRPFFRACLACVPKRLFSKSPSRAIELLTEQISSREERSASRYFYLLDFVLGNGFTNGLAPGLLSQAVEIGLTSFSSIPPPWPEFFRTVLDALAGNKEKSKRILEMGVASRSYCLSLLPKGQEHG